MRRNRPRLITFVAAVAAVLLAAAVGGWLLDFAGVQCVVLGGRIYLVHVSGDPSSNAQVTVGIESRVGSGQEAPALVVRHRVEWPGGEWGESVSRPLDGPPRWTVLGAAAWSGVGHPPPRKVAGPSHPPVGHWVLAVPLWWGGTPAAVLAAVAVTRAARRRMRRGRGLCPTCGYDIRATPGRCPECGTETMDPVGGLGVARRTPQAASAGDRGAARGNVGEQ